MTGSVCAATDSNTSRIVAAEMKENLMAGFDLLLIYLLLIPRRGTYYRVAKST